MRRSPIAGRRSPVACPVAGRLSCRRSPVAGRRSPPTTLGWKSYISCSTGGDECRSDLISDQRRFGFLEASLMHSRLDSALDFKINLFAACRTVDFAIGFGFGSFPAPFKPSPALLSIVWLPARANFLIF